MAQFGTNEIDEAKRRVQDMQSRAKNLTNTEDDGELNCEKLKLYIELFTPLAKKDKDLAAVMLSLFLSKNQEVDKMLILALLFILL
ncbi:MAG: hypothetical protein IJS03_00140 [Eubacterium sp.]|nr:hypothetical protein [Eubacterium sp.]